MNEKVLTIYKGHYSASISIKNSSKEKIKNEISQHLLIDLIQDIFDYYYGEYCIIFGTPSFHGEYQLFEIYANGSIEYIEDISKFVNDGFILGHNRQLLINGDELKFYGLSKHNGGTYISKFNNWFRYDDRGQCLICMHKFLQISIYDSWGVIYYIQNDYIIITQSNDVYKWNKMENTFSKLYCFDRLIKKHVFLSHRTLKSEYLCSCGGYVYFYSYDLLGKKLHRLGGFFNGEIVVENVMIYSSENQMFDNKKYGGLGMTVFNFPQNSLKF